jgi:hypothetical protein
MLSSRIASISCNPGADREREQPFTEFVREVGHHEATVSGRAISAAAFFVW